MSNSRFRQRRLSELAAGSDLAQTPRGPIEYKKLGEAPFVLQLHGTPGGYDQSLSIGEPFVDAGMGSISVSRPGYLRTPISVGRTPAEQADAMVDLLDVLEIEQIVVQGVSGGGPSAVQLAARHPERISSLILTCAVSCAYPTEIPTWSRLVMTPLGMRFGEWMFRRFPRAAVKQVIGQESTYSRAEVEACTERVMNDQDALDFLLGMTRSGTPWEDRQGGFDNDMEAILRLADDPLPLEDIDVPTLLVHGTADNDVPYAVALEANGRISSAELFTIENASHLLWIDPALAGIEARLVEFVRTNSHA